jgi:hypothetical protein
MMKNIRLLIAGVGFAQFGFLARQRFVPQITLWGKSYIAHVGKIIQRIVVVVIPDGPARWAYLLASAGKGGIAAFASRTSVTPFCGVLEV